MASDKTGDDTVEAKRKRNAPWRTFETDGIRIYKPAHPGDRFRILFRDFAGTERERSGGKTERSALIRAQELAREQAAGLDGIWTIGKLLDSYVKPENHRTRRGKPWGIRYSQEEARRVRLHIRPQLSVHKAATTLTPQDFIRILNLAGQKLQPSTVETIGKTCRAIVSFAQMNRVLDGDPMMGVHYIVPSRDGEDVRRVDPDTIPTMDSVLQLGFLAGLHTDRRIAAARNGRGGNRIVDSAGVLGRSLQPCFAAGSGLRFGELAALRADQVDVSSLVIHVAAQWVEPGNGIPPFVDAPKHGKLRDAVFAGWLEEPIREYLAMRVRLDGPNALLFPAPAGGYLTRRNHSRWWQPVRRAAGWDSSWTWTSLRHLFAVTALAPRTQAGWGMTLEEVSRLLGHHSPNFTARRYLTVRVGAEERATAAAREATV